MRCVRQEKTDSTSTLGIVKARIAGQSGQALSAFAVIASKITSSIMLRKEKYTAAHLSAHAKCSTMYPYVIILLPTKFCLVGSQDLKCLCKHSYKEHHPVTRKC